ncbi:MAG: hypothetical protein RI564_08550 [Gracilimonas sp.]|jgi:hypothetical protein|nr:hypothetical protein [Gracilimonas sp.]
MKFCQIGIVVLCFLTFQGCLNNVEDISETPDIDPSSVSYSEDIQPILTSSCGGSGCHISSSTSGVNLSTYNSVINSVGSRYGEAIVDPGNPDGSPLVDKIEPNPEIGSRMPLGRSFLTNEEIGQIRAWIEGGAEDN